MRMLLAVPPEGLLEDVLEQRALGRLATTLALQTACGAALYGAVLGAWRSPLLALYVALKLPLVLLVTASLTMLFNWVVAVLLQVPLTLPQAWVLALLPLAFASLLLAALSPIALLFTLEAPPPTDTSARAIHNLLLLLHTSFVGGAGLAGAFSLSSVLSRICATPRQARRVHATWVLTFAVVGGEVSWVLRPFVGSIYFPVVFLREDALSGNLYEFILRDVLPYLLRGHT